VVQGTRGVRCAHVYRVLSSSPTRRTAVRGAMILSKEVRTVKVRGRNPGVFVVTIPFPANEILGFAPKTPVAKNFLEFIINMTVRELNGGWGRGLREKAESGVTDAKARRVKRCGYREKEGAGGDPDGMQHCLYTQRWQMGRRAAELGH
jgi:hypothetical protein